jgi:hypothetical protein
MDVGTAYHAFNQATSALQQLGVLQDTGSNLEPPTPSLWTRWPIAISVITAVIVTVTAVAAGVFGNIALAVGQGICSIALGLLTFHIYNTMDLWDLEKYITIFAARIKELADTVLGLSATNTKLDRTETELREQIRIQEENFAEAKIRAEDALQKLSAVTDKLGVSESALAQMKSILAGSRQMLTEVSGTIQRFVSVNQGLSASSHDLEKQIQGLSELQQKFTGSLSQIGHQSDELSSYKIEAEKIAQNLFAQFMQIATLLASFKKDEEFLQKGLLDLQQIDTSLATHTGALKQEAITMHRDADRLETDLKTIDTFIHAVDTIAPHSLSSPAALPITRTTAPKSLTSNPEGK